MTKIICVVSKLPLSNLWNIEGKYYSSIQEAKKMIDYFLARNKAVNEIQQKYFREDTSSKELEYKIAELVIK